MTKTCGKCGHAALDDQAQFCNRCGAPVPDKKQTAFPVCPKCGTVVSDELAQFCNRCGIRIPPVPVLCTKCGSPAIDAQSRFCTRCGTTFEQKFQKTATCPSCGAPDSPSGSLFCNRCGAPFNLPGAAGSNQPVQVIMQKKPAGSLPVVTIPDAEWEPWNDVPSAPNLSRTTVPALPEKSALRDRQVAVSQKRFAHLPLVAEDMKKKSPDVPQNKKTVPQKKGVLGFMKK